MCSLLSYTSDDFDSSIKASIDIALSYLSRKRYDKCMSIVENIASIEYNINNQYLIPELMKIIYSVNQMLFVPKSIIPRENYVIFFESIANDNKGLTQQYLHAISSIPNVKVLFVHESCMPEDSIKIRSQLESHRIEIIELGNFTIIEKAKRLEDIITDFRPEKVFYHLKPNSIVPFLALNNISGVNNIQINLTDHAFWLGDSSFFDYIIEFRDYGAMVSLEKRGFIHSQIVKIPFYPWLEGLPFQGFSNDFKDKKILFSGGSLYKIEGDGNTFLDIVRDILTENKHVYFLYAGSGNPSYLLDYIQKNSLSDRFLFLGNRSDIVDVFENIDVYIDTYPFNGGLMCQLAAIKGKPILAYKSKDAEEVVCTKKNSFFVFNNKEELIVESIKLFSDKKYYLERSSYFSSLIANQKDFNENFKKFYYGDLNTPINSLNVDYDGFCQQYINRINNGSNGRDIELAFLRISPKVLTLKMWLILLFNISDVLNKIIKYIKNDS